jgi:hypothetical protein
MADKSKTSETPVASETPESAPQMFKVKLNKVVRLHGMDFTPRMSIHVNQATLDLMGDAVEDAKPV